MDRLYSSELVRRAVDLHAGRATVPSMTKRPRVTVLGSLNMDISVTVPRLPGPGATVLGSRRPVHAGREGRQPGRRRGPARR